MAMNWRKLLSSICLNKTASYQSYRGVANVPPTATGQRRFRMPVETDPKKLVNFCCGLDYNITQKPVELKPDSEYPDWLWSLRLVPKKPSWELEVGTKEYYETLHQEEVERKNRLARAQGKPKKVVGRKLLERKEWLHHIRFRALAHMEEDPGFDVDQTENDMLGDPLKHVNRSAYYLPPEPDKVVYADKIPGNLYRKNYRSFESDFHPKYTPCDWTKKKLSKYR